MANSRFHHEEIYRGKDLQVKLATKHVTVCGVGALGSNLVDTLVRQSFKNLRVIDKDRVEPHNIGTQIWMDADVGAFKTEALKNRMFRTTGVEIESVSKELTASTAKNLLKKTDLVLDMFDNSASRALVQNECRARKIPCLHAGLFEDYGEIIWDGAYTVPKDVAGDVCDYPLARNLIVIASAVAAEEVLSFCLDAKPRMGNWTITLRDLTVRRQK